MSSLFLWKQVDFMCIKKEVFEKMQTRIGETPFLYCIDEIEGVDIDEKDDFEVAQHILADIKGLDI